MRAISVINNTQPRFSVRLFVVIFYGLSQSAPSVVIGSIAANMGAMGQMYLARFPISPEGWGRKRMMGAPFIAF